MNLCFFTFWVCLWKKQKCSDTLNYSTSSTFPSFINFFLSHWTPNPNAEKKKNRKGLPVPIFPVAMNFVLETFALAFCTFLSQWYGDIWKNYYSHWPFFLFNKKQSIKQIFISHQHMGKSLWSWTEKWIGNTYLQEN